MTKRIIFITASIFLLSITGAYADTLTYSPSRSGITISDGEQDIVAFDLGISDAHFTEFFVWSVDRVEGGNLPASWITAIPESAIVKSDAVLPITLTVSVPQGTAPATYSGYVYSKAMASHVFADPGTGHYLEVAVPSRCGEVPFIEITDFGPDYIWPPDKSMDVVTVAGKVTLSAGCSLAEVGYRIDDEYGIHTSSGTLPVNGNGEFSLPLPVEAWRTGHDKDGRIYTIVIFAVNEFGNGTSGPLHAIVPHDMREKP